MVGCYLSMGSLFWRAIGTDLLVVEGGSFGYGELIVYVRR